jgi:tetratricopeptide (TPR) repeat protein
MGFCHWPTCGSGRLDSIRNCRKAILHGTFYGPGAVVAFDSLSLNVSGDLYFDEGDYKQAIKEYQAGLQMNPGDINLLNSLGVALAEVNRHREAMACFSGVLQQNPENHMALVNKGMSCRQLGRKREAVQCFEKALQCSDHEEHASLEFYLQLARLYCILEKYDQAVILLDQWRTLKGEPEEFMYFTHKEEPIGPGNTGVVNFGSGDQLEGKVHTNGDMVFSNYGCPEFTGEVNITFEAVENGGGIGSWGACSDDIFEEEIRKQVEIAIDEADAVIFLVDVSF